MRRFLKAFSRDARGLAALEFALVAPLIGMLLVVGVDVWLQLQAANRLDAAVRTAARYYRAGGSDDAQARALFAGARPVSGGDAPSLSIARACVCGDAAQNCGTICPSLVPPALELTLSTSATYESPIAHRRLSAQEVVRVR